MNYANDIKHLVPTKDAVEFYGFSVNRSGFVNCPFHGEDTPSLKVYDGFRGWHCFGCGLHGDVTDFVARLFNLTFKEAQAKINDDFRLGLPIGKVLTKEERDEAQRKADAWRRKMEEKHKRRETAKKAYFNAFDRWAKLDIISRREAPKRGEETLKPGFVELLKALDRASDDLDKAQGEYYSILLEEKVDS